jgi:hypothetical protein
VTHQIVRHTVKYDGLSKARTEEGFSFHEIDLLEEEAIEIAQFARNALSRIELQVLVEVCDSHKNSLSQNQWQFAIVNTSLTASDPQLLENPSHQDD